MADLPDNCPGCEGGLERTYPSEVKGQLCIRCGNCDSAVQLLREQ